MATKTPRRSQATRTARKGSEDVVPADPGTAYDGEEAEPVIDTLKPARERKVRQPSRGRVDVPTSTVSEAEEKLAVQKLGKGKTGKGEEVKQQFPTKTPARERPRKNSRAARSKPIEPDQGLPDYEDEEEEEARLFNPKPLTMKRDKDREPVREHEPETPLEEDAAGQLKQRSNRHSKPLAPSVSRRTSLRSGRHHHGSLGLSNSLSY